MYTDSGREAIQHVVVTPSRESRAAALPPGYVAPPRRGGSADYFFFVRFYVDDGVSVEVQCYPSGDRCLCASASLASDHFRSFGYRAPTAPPLLSKHNFCHWDTQLAVLGWEIDSVAMTISLTKAKVAKLRRLLLKWPRSRRYALESEVRELVGKLLYASKVVRSGNFFLRRMLNQHGLPPVNRWQEKLGGSSPRSRRGGRLALGPEIHADVEFWRLMMSEEFARLLSHLSSPLYTFFLQRRSRTLVSDALGTAVGRYCLEMCGGGLI